MKIDSANFSIRFGRLVCLALVALIAFLGFAEPSEAAPGEPDPTFQTAGGANGTVWAVQPLADAKILIGGSFSRYNNQPFAALARLNADGSLDTSFANLSFIGLEQRQPEVYALALQPDGKIVVGGNFVKYANAERFKIMRLNPDGTLDQTFSVSPDYADLGIVQKIGVQADGKILLVKNSRNANNQPTAGVLTRLNTDGSVDPTFKQTQPTNQEITGFVLQADSKIVVTGAFTMYNSIRANRIVRLTPQGEVDLTFQVEVSPQDTIRDVKSYKDGRLLLIGGFSYIDKIVRLHPNGSRDSTFSFREALAINPDTITIQEDSRVLIGGSTVDYYQHPTKQSALIRLNIDGTLDTGFKRQPTDYIGVIGAIALQNDGKIILGGSFNSYGDATRSNLARANSDGALDKTFDSGRGANRGITAAAVQPDGKILVGGHFNTYDEYARNTIVRLKSDGSLDLTFRLDSKLNWCVISKILVYSQDKILVGGECSIFGTWDTNGLLLLNSDGSINPDFTPDLGSSAEFVQHLLVQPDGKIVVVVSPIYGGNGTLRRLNANGSVDQSFQTNVITPSSISHITLLADGKIMVGGELYLNGQEEKRYLLKLNANGSLDNDFVASTKIDNRVTNIAVQADGNLILTYYRPGTPGERVGDNIIRLRANGSHDPTFNFELADYSWLDTILVQPDGRLILSHVRQETKGYHIIRLFPDGEIDTSFNAPFQSSNTVVETLMQPDGKLIVFGDFRGDYGGHMAHIVRLLNDFELVTKDTDDGTGTIVGTFSYALTRAALNPASSVVFQLPAGANTITFIGALLPSVPSGVSIVGGSGACDEPPIILNGNGVPGDGLRLQSKNTLINLVVRNFGGREIVSTGRNRSLKCVKAAS